MTFALQSMRFTSILASALVSALAISPTTTRAAEPASRRPSESGAVLAILGIWQLTNLTSGKVAPARI